jgi:hypothetical protein
MSHVMDAPFSHAMLMLGFMAVLSALGYVFFPERPIEGVVYRPDFLWILGRAIGNFVFYFLSFGLIGAVAEHVLDARMTTREFLSLMCHASLAGFMLLIPSLFPAVALWWLFIMHEALTKLGKLGTGSVLFLLCIQFVFSLIIGYTYFPFSG